jgi:CheY-like chemotaxis protein/anti-sigma regulatory factor (Ser/Thr protein kinase)
MVPVMNAARILIVEDEPINQEVLVDVLQEEGYRTTIAATGTAAWECLSRDPAYFDLVLLDRMMPDMDGIEVLRRMKAQPALVHTPVIMQTSMTSDVAVAEGLKAGAYYYLTKPVAADTLLAIVAAAAEDRLEYLELQRAVRQATRTLTCLTKAEFSFRTTEEARDIATALASVAPEPERAVLGLSELMLNAVEHGNLGISYEEKSRLLADDGLGAEVARRLSAPEFCRRRAVVEFRREPLVLRFVIRDEGKGFDWRKYIEMSPERAFDLHGRGIAMSKLVSFDHLQYLGAGNAVEALVELKNGEMAA